MTRRQYNICNQTDNTMNTTKNPTKQAYADFLTDVRQFLPSDRIYTDELRRLGWGTDASFYREIPEIVIRSD